MEKEYGILIYSCKSKGQRIAYYEEIINGDDYLSFVKYKDILKSQFKKVISFPLHFINIDDIDNIGLKDHFFENIQLISDFKLFREEISKDLKINYIDLAKLALQHKEYSKLYLQNIMYFIDAIYTRVYKEKLIEENFVVYTHGPMLNSFYSKYKSIDKNPLPKLSLEDKLSLYSRMIQISGGLEANKISRQVYKEYGNNNNTKIYEQGHHKLSAWKYIKDQDGDKSLSPITKKHILDHEKSLFI